jgi:ACS family tartrate transporter-like MFS transporter
VGAQPALAIAMLTLAAGGIMCYYAPCWALPTRFLSQGSAAAGFGFINLIANFGGFCGPYMVGFLTDRTGSHSAGVYFMASTAAMAALVMALLPRNPERQ